jgi:hypothetical protein
LQLKKRMAGKTVIDRVNLFTIQWSFKEINWYEIWISLRSSWLNRCGNGLKLENWDISKLLAFKLFIFLKGSA